MSAALPTNKLVWPETNSGKFTVGSAYKLAVTLFKSRNHGTTSDGSLLRKFWKKVWSLPIPHNVKKKGEKGKIVFGDDFVTFTAEYQNYYLFQK